MCHEDVDYINYIFINFSLLCVKLIVRYGVLFSRAEANQTIKKQNLDL